MGRQSSPVMKDACVQTYFPGRGILFWKNITSVLPSAYLQKTEPKEKSSTITVCFVNGLEVEINFSERFTVKVHRIKNKDL